VKLLPKYSVVKVTTGDHNYVVTIGRHLRTSVYRDVVKRLRPRRVFLVFDANFYALHGPALEHHWRKASSSVASLVLPSGETQKRQATVELIHDQLIESGLSREDLVVACGGGVTSDITGFAAATLYRGVRWGICATTLLSMADASIGGKTGVNHTKGKNLIGAYWQPSFVVDDTEWLKTLPEREFRSGSVEIIKSAGLAGGQLFRLVSRWADNSFSSSHPKLTVILKATVAYKAKVVGRDQRDFGRRLHLNFGHTIGHAVEQSLGYKRLTHGEAVLLGMIGAMSISNRLRISRTDRLEPFHRIVYGALPRVPKVKLDPDRIFDGMRFDKKRSNQKLRFVLLIEPGKPVVRDVPESGIKSAIDEIIRLYEYM
jgi:3-dehydroquinate synthase